METSPPPARPPAPYLRFTLLGLSGLAFICILLWGLGMVQSGQFGNNAQATITALAQADLTCKELVETAMQQSDEACQNMGSNQLCYGNTALEAEIAGEVADIFHTRGDIIDVDILRRLSASPLDLLGNQWGIAIFKITANLPRSLPGENVTMIAFGNTRLEKDGPGIETFYFYNELGQIICDEVPFDGLMITMPPGTGIQLNINGAELVLLGNASLTANQGGSMQVNLYSGAGQITVDGETVSIGPGQQVSIPMDGGDGTTVSGPPSSPQPLSPEELELACSLTGQFCTPQDIPTSSSQSIAATLTGIPTSASSTSSLAALPTLQASATGMPTIGLPVAPSATPKPATAVPTKTRTPEPPPAPTYTPTQTATAMPTATATATATATSTATSTATGTSTSTATATSTAIPVTCSTITWGSMSYPLANQIAITITNGSGATVSLENLVVNWVELPMSQHLTSVSLDGNTLWTGSDPNSPTTFPSERAWTGTTSDREIADTTSEQLLITFDEDLQISGYSLQAIFSTYCQLQASN